MSPARGESGSQPWKGPPRPPQPRASPETRALPLARLSTFVLFTNMLPEFQWVIYSVAPSIFPPRPCRWLTQGPVATVRRKDQSKRILFNFFFFFFFRFRSFLSLPAPSLLALLYPFLLQDRSNWSPGGSYRECIGSLGEKSPNKLYTRCIMLYGQTGKHKSRKTKGVN